MKKIFILTTLALTVIACGDKKPSVDDVIASGNLEDIRAKRDELSHKQDSLELQLKRLDDAIKDLDTNKKLPLVTAVAAVEENFLHYLEIQGDVTTKQNVVLHPEFNGILTQVFVKEGQKVSKGQLLATIDDGGLSQQLSQLEVQVALSKTTFERQEKLWNQKIGSEIQYLQAKANYEAQQKAINQLKAQLAKTRVVAPFSGIIDDIITEQGNVVNAGMSELMRIVNLDDMYIESEIPESYLGSIKVGTEVQIFLPVIGDSIISKVRQVGSYINPSNRTFKIEVAIPNKNHEVKPNLTAQLKINDYVNPKAILIPQSVISENAEGDQYVYVTTKDTASNGYVAHRLVIKTGKTEGDYVEILEGLKNGDTIVVEGARSVKDGQAVDLLKVEGHE